MDSSRSTESSPWLTRVVGRVTIDRELEFLDGLDELDELAEPDRLGDSESRICPDDPRSILFKGGNRGR